MLCVFMFFPVVHFFHAKCASNAMWGTLFGRRVRPCDRMSSDASSIMLAVAKNTSLLSSMLFGGASIVASFSRLFYFYF